MKIQPINANDIEFFRKSGTGIVTGQPRLHHPADRPAGYRIVIEVPSGIMRVKRRVTPTLDRFSPLLFTVAMAADAGAPVDWTLELHRHPWVPPDVAIRALDWDQDLFAVLTELQFQL